MRIALVAEDYYPQLGGVPEHVHHLAHELVRRGHAVAVITSRLSSPRRDHPDDPFVHRIGKSLAIYANGGLARVTLGWQLERQLRDLLRRGRYDLVHVHGGLAPTFGIVAPMAAFRAGLLFLGRLEPRNGLATVLAAMPAILDRYPGTELAVVGDGPWRRYYEWQARRLGRAVRFVGAAWRERPELYGGADLYLCPVTRSSFGVTLLEAMACGTPIVASNITGVRELVNGGSEAVLVPEQDATAWAAAVVRLLGDAHRRGAMGAAGRAKAMQFDWQRVADRIVAVHERVVAR